MIYKRNQLEELEEKVLAPYAVKSRESSGRKFAEPEDDFRLCFQKDRDRVLHSRAFRRLKGKTQVFVAHHGDHYRTRISHSLEVAQVSRDLARSLGLNQDLAETIALAHDLGHTPFGHAGEQALDAVMKEFGSHYEHNEQSKRIVEELEQVYPQFPGLNLTQEVREGLMKHKSSWDNAEKEFNYLSLEAQIVNLADEIAYQAHDVEDGLRAQIIDFEEVRNVPLWQAAVMAAQMRHGADLSGRWLRQGSVAALMSLMIFDVIQETERRIQKNKIVTLADVKEFPEGLVGFSGEFNQKNQQLRNYLYEHFYMHPAVLQQSQRGQKILTEVFWLYYKNVQPLPEKFQARVESGEAREIVIKDYVAGMTDAFVEAHSLATASS